MNKPYVICHMAVDRWPHLHGNVAPESGRPAEYERTAATSQADAWMCGRIPMAAYASA